MANHKLIHLEMLQFYLSRSHFSNYCLKQAYPPPQKPHTPFVCVCSHFTFSVTDSPRNLAARYVTLTVRTVYVQTNKKNILRYVYKFNVLNLTKKICSSFGSLHWILFLNSSPEILRACLVKVLFIASILFVKNL